MRKKLVIVADDLTGAGDTGVQFCRSGLIVNVIIGQQRFQEEMDQCDVLVVDLESRMDTRDMAFEKHYHMGRKAADYGDVIVYKKLDSTLRGNVGAEIEGLMEGLGVGVTLLAPGLPGGGRTVVNGEVYVRGVRLADTEFAIDPCTPVRSSSVEKIVGEQSGKPCHVITTGVFSGGMESAIARLSEQLALQNGIFIFDSSEEKDLENIAGLVEHFAEGPVLMAGSSGLARHLGRGNLGGRLVGLSGQKGEDVAGRRVGGSLSFVFAGSVSRMTQEQVQYAWKRGDCELVYLREADEGSFPGIVENLRSALAGGRRRFIFATALSREDVRTEMTAAAKVLGNLAALLISTFHPSGLLLTGGETAIHTVNVLGGKGIRVVGEVLPGIQYGYLTGGEDGRSAYGDRPATGCVVVTKAGGFGEQDSIFRILEFLTI